MSMKREVFFPCDFSVSGSVGLLMKYRKEGGCLKQNASGFLCTCDTRTRDAVVENFTSVWRDKAKKKKELG